MKLIDHEWNKTLCKVTNTWLANDESEIVPGFDPESAEGSVILVISTSATFIKNADGAWQKVGTTEVIV